MRIKHVFPTIDTQMQEVLSRASVVFFLRVLGAVAQFSFTVALARIYGAEGMGVFVLGLSVTVIASAVSRWGLDQAALKNISVYAEAEAWDKLGNVFLSGFSLVLLFSLLVTILLFPLSQWIAESLFSQARMSGLLQMMLLSIVPFSLLNFTAEALRALKRSVANTLVQVVFVPSLAIVLLLGFQTVEVEIIGASYAYVLACYMVCFFSLWLWRSKVAKDDNVSEPAIVDTARGLIRTASPMAWVSIIGIAMSFSETILLGVFRGVEEVGVYTAALRVALLVNFVLVAFNTILAPRFAAMFDQGKHEEMEILAVRSIMFMLILTMPIFAVCIFVPQYVLQLFGDEFISGSMALVILALGQLANVMTGPVGMMLLMTGHERQMRRNSIISALLGVLAGMLLVPDFGVVGAALSAFTGIMTLQGLSVWSARKHLKINLFHGLRLAG